MLKYKKKTCLIFIAGSITLILSIIFDSRAIFLSGLLSLIITLRWLTIKTIFLWMFLLIFFVLFYKTDSTRGRVLVYKNSIDLLCNNFSTGVGVGNFQREYLKQQAFSFSLGKNNNYFYLADDTRFSFNDYLGLLCETGILGIILLILFFVSVIGIIKINNYTLEGLLAKFILISIFLSAFVTHVFERPYICGITCIILLYLTSCIRNTFILLVSKQMSYLVLLISFFLTSYEVYLNQRMNKINFDILTGQYALATKKIEDLIKHNQCNELCLFEYSKIKFLHGNYDDSESIMIDILQKYSSSLYYSHLAESQFKLRKYNEAIKNYKIAINMVPSRFEPRVNLLYLYNEVGDYDKSSKVKEDIISLKEKIPTKRTNYIKNNINLL